MADRLGLRIFCFVLFVWLLFFLRELSVIHLDILARLPRPIFLTRNFDWYIVKFRAYKPRSWKPELTAFFPLARLTFSCETALEVPNEHTS